MLGWDEGNLFKFYQSQIFELHYQFVLLTEN